MKNSLAKMALFILLSSPVALWAQPANNWWNQSVFYELFTRSFYDSDGNGIGDFNGITAKLNYLNDGDSITTTDLGIKGIWLMPINASPSYHGYDVTNYKAVSPQYGTIADFKNMVTAAHNKGIKVVIDFVINHTSSQHPWFVKSAANDPFYRNFYRWSDTKPTYKGPWGQDVWYSKSGSNYYALFWSEMPDLNYNYQPVKDSIYDAAHFWLDSIGIDGFRLDAAMYLYENGSSLMNQPETYQFWLDFNTYCKTINPNVMLVGEVWTNSNTVKNYNNKLSYCFEFDLAGSILSSVKAGNTVSVRDAAKYSYDNLLQNEFGTFLTNHDQNRVFDELAGDDNKLKTAASMYLTLPGVPYLYYGEEIAMKGAKPDEDIRKPMQWSNTANAGFSSASPWRAVNANYTTYNVATMQANNASILSHYKRLIDARNQNEALTIGTFQNSIATDTSVFSFVRLSANQKIVVLINTSNRVINNLTISLASSSIPNRTYAAKDLLSNSMETFNVNGSLVSSLTLNPYQTKILLLGDNVGIDEAVASQISIFPNPANNQIYVSALSTDKKVQLSITNQLGQEVYNNVLAANQTSTIDIENLIAGVYFIKLNNGKALKFIKL
ncbi:MAG: alpha-amylase family glycosyl hydrolase [Bacteroidota bacterium]